MANLNRYLTSITPQGADRARRHRLLAAVLSLLLAFASLSPAWAFAATEADSEGQGGGSPGIPGLEVGPEFDPGGDETVLEDQPAQPGEEEEPPSPESEPPAAEAPPPEPPAVQPKAPPPSPEPIYESSEGTEYQTEPPAPVVVHGESIDAPPAPPQPPESQPQQATPPAPQPESEPRSAPPPAEALAPAALAAAAMPAEAARPPEGLGRDVHVVRPGESLWSIATALLPVGADDAQIAAKVQRLWELNRERIGSGDPDLIYVGTVLLLR